MSKNSMPSQLPRERALLVGVAIKQNPGFLTLDDSLSELTLLAKTAGLDVIGEVRQNLDRPNAKTYLGSGKVEEVRELISELVADVLLFDDELIPRHQRELERAYGDSVRIVDRTALILDIFAQHAATREGALQVELAQYEYILPRLTRAWTHLARQAGGGGGRAGSVGGVGLRGPGETQLEVDRRDIRRRISHLREELEKVREHRGRHRARRKEAAIPTIALVGYTNAGKSTLLNKLSRADVYVANELFATLDPTTRKVILPSGRKILITDTVGFIQKLPTTLVAAFRATLEEIRDADILLHVVDITHANADLQAKSVLLTLEEIEAEHIPIVTALNKIDQMRDEFEVEDAVDRYDRAVPISALKGTGTDLLLSVLENEI
jgi:GTP-binding protein HflX